MPRKESETIGWKRGHVIGKGCETHSVQFILDDQLRQLVKITDEAIIRMMNS